MNMLTARNVTIEDVQPIDGTVHRVTLGNGVNTGSADVVVMTAEDWTRVSTFVKYSLEGAGIPDALRDMVKAMSVVVLSETEV